MAATLRTPEIAQAHANNLFYEVMEFMATIGMFDLIPDAARGGTYVYRPRIGRIAGGVAERTNAASLSSSATQRSTSNTSENMVVVHRHKLTDYYVLEPQLAGVAQEFYELDLGRQMAQLFAQRLKQDLYYIAIASAQDATLDHTYSVFVDTATAGSQVDLTSDVLQAGKYKMTDLMELLNVGVVHSKQWNDMRVEQLTDANFVVPNVVGDLFRGVMFRNILGVTFIVDDQIPTNYIDGTSAPSNATLYNALLLRGSGVDPHGRAPMTVSMQAPLKLETQHVLAEQSRRNQIQGFASWALGVSGSAWDVSSGGANPADSALGTASNWDDSTDDHEMHGIVHLATN